MIELIKADQLSDAGIKHGWFKRHGGISPVPFASLNTKVSDLVPDSIANSANNQQLAYERFGLNHQPVVMLQLVSQDRVQMVATPGGSRTLLQTDGAATNLADYSLALTVADCLPVLLADPTAGVIGVAHAGWAGAANKITAQVVELMCELGASPSNIQAAFGPAICGRCYEVKDDVSRYFDAKYLRHATNQMFLDIPAAVRTELEQAGVTQFEDVKICTFEHVDDWFSARKEGTTGRFLAIIQNRKI